MPGHMFRIALEDWSILASYFSVTDDLHQKTPTPACFPGHSQQMQYKFRNIKVSAFKRKSYL